MSSSHPSDASRLRQQPRQIGLRYTVEDAPDRWLLEDESVPETPLHDAIIELLMLILKHWAHTHAVDALVTSNLGCRWDPADARVGIDPDVVLVTPAPPEGEHLTTLRVWEPQHRPPRIAVEIVSTNTADKDYLDAPARAARLGVEELWIFDPLRQGPASTGGPFVLQVWRCRADPEGTVELERCHAGAAPAFSEALGAWLVCTDGSMRLRLAQDAEGTRLWPTRAEAEAARAEAAEREVARLEQLLAKR